MTGRQEILFQENFVMYFFYSWFGDLIWKPKNNFDEEEEDKPTLTRTLLQPDGPLFATKKEENISGYRCSEYSVYPDSTKKEGRGNKFNEQYNTNRHFIRTLVSEKKIFFSKKKRIYSSFWLMILVCLFGFALKRKKSLDIFFAIYRYINFKYIFINMCLFLRNQNLETKKKKKKKKWKKK